jgi:hypothetical protein
MNSKFKWAIITGVMTALINFMISMFMSLICGVFTSPIAAGIATYLSMKEYPEQNLPGYRAKIGLIVGSISSLGGILGAVASLILLSFAFAVFSSENMPPLEEMFSYFHSSGLMIGIGSVVFASIFITGLCVGTAAITGMVLSKQNSLPQK